MSKIEIAFAAGMSFAFLLGLGVGVLVCREAVEHKAALRHVADRVHELERAI